MPSGSAAALQAARWRSSSSAVSCAVVERRARQFELAARLERNGRRRLRVVEADQVAGVLDPLPAELGVHRLEQRADCPGRPHRGRATGRRDKRDLLVLRADPKGPDGLHPASNQAASASRDSMISPSTTSRAINLAPLRPAIRRTAAR